MGLPPDPSLTTLPATGRTSRALRARKLVDDGSLGDPVVVDLPAEETPAEGAPRVDRPAGDPFVVIAAATPSFEDFYQGEYERMVRLAYLIVGSTETAEELVQDSFIRVHQQWRRLDNPRAYLRTAVVNGCRDRIRRRTRLRARVPVLTSEAMQHATTVPDSGERPDLVEALRSLPLRQRSALVLRFYGGFSEAEIATTLGVQRGTVKSLVHRGLEQLREVMAE